MQRYRETLHHLNAALDIMVEQGDTHIVANIAHPIALVERTLREHQIELVMQHFPQDQAR